MSYIGAVPPGSAGVYANYTESFSGDASNTQFTLAYKINSYADIEVVVNNVQQNPYANAFTIANNGILVFPTAPSSGNNNIVVYYRSFTKPADPYVFSGFTYTPANSTFTVAASSGNYSANINYGNSSVAGLLQIVDSVSNTSTTIAASANNVKAAYELAGNAVSNATAFSTAAYTNAVSYADTKAAAAYSNSSAYADAKAANAYANATSYADTVAGTAYANAVATANTSARSYADAKAANAYANVFNGGTFSGNVIFSSNVTANTVRLTGNMQIDGDLLVTGNTVTMNVTSLSVEDNMIYLNASSNVANPDLGFAGNYNDGTYRHAGLFRDATDGIWKFFHQYQPEPDASAYIDTSNNTFALANLQGYAFISGGGGLYANGTIAGGNTTITGYITVTEDSSFTSNGAVQLPSGNTGQRPTGAGGKLRFNNETNQFEGYNGSAWASVGGAAINNDTSTSSNLYPLFASSTTGTALTVYTSNSKLLYKPSTGELQATATVSTNGLLVHGTTVTENYTLPAGFNALSVGPLTIANGVTVTLSSGSRHIII